MSYGFCDFGLLRSSRLRDPILDPPGLRFGSFLAVKTAETSLGIPLGAAKSCSRRLFFGLRAVQEHSKRSPRPLQEASMRPRRSKKGPRGLWGPIFTPPGPLGTSKTTIWGMKTPRDLKNSNLEHEISMLPRSPGGLPGALYKTSKSMSRYSKTSLLCQEFSKIFQDNPPRASLLERKPRSLHQRIPRRARAGRRGP